MALTPLFANNAASLLVAPITSAATTATLTPGTGVLFPSPITGQFFPLTFVSAANSINSEIVYVTAISGDTITAMERGQEGTTAQAFATGDAAQLLITAGALNIIGTPSSAAPLPVAQYAFSALPAATGYTPGATAFCTNGCNIGETTGNGTGCPVFVKVVSTVNTWCAVWSGIAVTD